LGKKANGEPRTGSSRRNQPLGREGPAERKSSGVLVQRARKQESKRKKELLLNNKGRQKAKYVASWQQNREAPNKNGTITGKKTNQRGGKGEPSQGRKEAGEKEKEPATRRTKGSQVAETGSGKKGPQAFKTPLRAATYRASMKKRGARVKTSRGQKWKKEAAGGWKERRNDAAVERINRERGRVKRGEYGGDRGGGGSMNGQEKGEGKNPWTDVSAKIMVGG